METKWWNRFCP